MSRLSAGVFFSVISASVCGIPLGFYEGKQRGDLSDNDVSMIFKTVDKADFIWNFSFPLVNLKFDFDCQDVNYSFHDSAVFIPQEGNPCIQNIADTFKAYFTLAGAMKLPYNEPTKTLHFLTGLADCVDVKIVFQRPLPAPVTTTTTTQEPSTEAAVTVGGVRTIAAVVTTTEATTATATTTTRRPTTTTATTTTTTRAPTPKAAVIATTIAPVTTTRRARTPKAAVNATTIAPVTTTTRAPTPKAAVNATTIAPVTTTVSTAPQAPIVFAETNTTSTTTKGANVKVSVIGTTMLMAALLAVVL